MRKCFKFQTFGLTNISTEPMIRVSKVNEKSPSHFEDINKL